MIRFLLSMVFFLFVFVPQVRSDSLLSERLAVEFVQPAHLNNNTATLVFDCLDDNDINVELAFKNHESGVAVANPMQILIDASQELYEVSIDISTWADSDYEVLIRELRIDSQDTGTLVRAIRKETILPPSNPDEPIDVAGRKILFVDDWYIAYQTRLTREIEQGTVIPIEAWKADPSYFRFDTWVEDFWVGRDQKIYLRLHARNGKDVSGVPLDETDYWVVSDDYESWSIISDPGKSENACRVVVFDEPKVGDTFLGNPTYRFYDADNDGPVKLSQVSIYNSGYNGVVLGNINIEPRSRVAVWERPTGEYLVLTPEPIVRDKWEFGENEIGTWKDTNDNFGPEHLSMDGNTLRFYQARCIPRNDPFRINYDNIFVSRILVVWSSQDGVNWTPSYFEVPDNSETIGLQHYGNYVFNEEENNLELAFVRMYDQLTQRTYTDFAYSRDGLKWNRFNSKPFLNYGDFGDWNFGFSYFSETRMRVDTGNAYIEPVVGINVPHFMFISVVNQKDRSYVTTDYYLDKYDGRLAGENGLQNSPIWDWYGSWTNIVDETKDMITTPGLVKYRKDGWVWLGNETDTGVLVTKVITAGHKLKLNAKTETDGYVLVEVLDEYGNELPDLSGKCGARFSGDSVNYPLSWNYGNITELPLQLVKLRITVHKGKLYSLNFGGRNRIIYVKKDANGIKDGSSWCNAFTDLQEALLNAESGDQIWVAQGIYKPTQDINNLLAAYKSFELKDGVSILGGFIGNETSFSQRDYETNETVLSGDLLSNDGGDFINYSDNSRHIIVGDNVDKTAILDGFTISGGNAQDLNSPHNVGAGLIVFRRGSPTIKNCKIINNYSLIGGAAAWLQNSGTKFINCLFSGNVTGDKGGAIYFYSNCTGSVEDCEFASNTAGRNGGAMRIRQSSVSVERCEFTNNVASTSSAGGAIIVVEGSEPTISDSNFTNNSATTYGGAIHVEGSSAVMDGCRFEGNLSRSGGAIRLQYSDEVTIDDSVFIDNGGDTATIDAIYGGAISNWGASNLMVKNSYFIGNETTLGLAKASYGGAIVAAEYGNTDIMNCVFAGNKSDRGGAIRLDSNIVNVTNCTFANNIAGIAGRAFSLSTSSTTERNVKNCILWDGSGEISYSSGLFSVEYSNVYGGWSGEGNINLDPKFSDSDGDDDILGTEDDNCRLIAASPCINAGNNLAVSGVLSFDIDNNYRIANTIVDMGAYEYGVCGDLLHPIPPGDITKDCRVDIQDLVILLNDWLKCTAPVGK